MINSNIEQKFIELVEQLRLEKEMTTAELVDAAWPELTDPKRKYRLLRVGVMPKTGKPMKLSLQDAERLARALGERLDRLLFDVMAGMRRVR